MDGIKMEPKNITVTDRIYSVIHGMVQQSNEKYSNKCEKCTISISPCDEVDCHISMLFEDVTFTIRFNYNHSSLKEDKNHVYMGCIILTKEIAEKLF